MNDLSRTSALTTCGDTPSTTSSPASVSGATPCARLDGPTTGLCGRAVALASLSPRQARAAGLLTSGTYGPPGSGSSASAALTSSLESRLRARTAGLGSTLFRLTWKVWTTPAGRSIPALRASALRTSGSGSTGWPTATRQDGASSGAYGYNGQNFMTLTDAARMAQWSTPRANKRGFPDAHGSREGPETDLFLWGVWAMNPGTDKDVAGIVDSAQDAAEGLAAPDLTNATATSASWPTPMAGTPARNGNNEAGNTDSSRKTVALCTWPTPCQQDGPKGGPSQGPDRLPAAAALAGWPTPVRNDDNKSVEAHLAMKRRMGERDGTKANRIAITSLQVAAKTAALAGWPTTTTSDGSGGGAEWRAMGERRHGSNLNDFAMLAKPPSSWATTTRDWRSDRSQLSSQELYGSKGQPLARQALYADSGETPTGSTAETASTGQLDPAHSRWLQGLPPAWDDCGVTAMRSMRSRRRSSSKQSRT